MSVEEFHRSLEQQRKWEAAAKPASPPAIDWSEVDRRCAKAAREAAIAVAHEVAAAMTKERAVQKRELDHSVRGLRVEVGALDESIGELRRTLTSNRIGNTGTGEIVDLIPNARRN